MKRLLLLFLLPAYMCAQGLQWSKGIPYDRNADNFEIAAIKDSLVCVENYNRGGVFKKSFVQHLVFHSKKLQLIKEYRLPPVDETRIYVGTLAKPSGFYVAYLRFRDSDHHALLEALPLEHPENPELLWQSSRSCTEQEVQAELVSDSKGNPCIGVWQKAGEDRSSLHLLTGLGTAYTKTHFCELPFSKNTIQLLQVSCDSTGHTGALLKCGATEETLFKTGHPGKTLFCHWTNGNETPGKISLSDGSSPLLGATLADAYRAVCLYRDIRNNFFRIRGFGVTDSSDFISSTSSDDDYAETSEKVTGPLKDTERIHMVFSRAIGDSLILLATEQTFSERICQPVPMGMRYTTMQCDNYYYNKNFGFYFLAKGTSRYKNYSLGNQQATMNDNGVFNSFVCGSEGNKAWMVWQEAPEKRSGRSAVMRDPFSADLLLLWYDLSSSTAGRSILQQASARGPVIKPGSCRYLSGTGFLLLGVRQGKYYLGTINP
jgi:hypothetical protein